MSKALVIKSADFSVNRLRKVILKNFNFWFAFISNADGTDYVGFGAPEYEYLAYADVTPMGSERLRLTGAPYMNCYIAPYVMPTGTAKVSVKANNLRYVYSCYVFFFASKEVSSLPKVAKMIQKIRQDAIDNAVDFTVDVPDGADSIVVMVAPLTTYTENDYADEAAEDMGFEIAYKTT